ncbi:protein ALP1-like [Senna tora]|uniref:Protein ALP1-like n=1 Tax=Senna tora TaxID=362788 RepID=A0A834WY82_9FABA|nr:protein ALP1-like [Senna tora]
MDEQENVVNLDLANHEDNTPKPLVNESYRDKVMNQRGRPNTDDLGLSDTEWEENLEIPRPINLKLSTRRTKPNDRARQKEKSLKFRGQRYHLNECREGRHPTTPREYFNMRHLAARNVIERCFRMLKNRWAILRSPSCYPMKTHNMIVIACCLLHNLIRRDNAGDPLDDEVENLVPEPAEEPMEEPAEVDGPISTVETSESWTLF